MTQKRPLTLLALSPLLLCCVSPSSSQEESFTQKRIDVHYVDPSLDQKATLRFYSSSGDVPYISMQEYFALLLKGRSEDPAKTTLRVSRDGDVYTVKSPQGQARFDVKADVMTTENLSFFLSTKTYESGYKAILGMDGMPWVKIDEAIAKENPAATRVDFSSYGIDVRGDKDALYLPLPTLQDLFSDSSMLTSCYNREDLYVYSGADESTDSFGTGIYEPCLKTDLGVNYAAYLYQEMCFDYDVLLGRPSRSCLERYYDLSHGLDRALESRPYGKAAKKYLTDGTALGYAIGLSMMEYLLVDGGHTHVDPSRAIMYDPARQAYVAPSWFKALRPAVQETLAKIKEQDYPEMKNAGWLYAHHDEMRQTRRERLSIDQQDLESLRGEQTYRKVGGNAFIFLDDFHGEFEQAEDWFAFYAGKGALPYGPRRGGAVSALHHGLEKARLDPSVKNIIVDLSSNTGGSVDEMMYAVSLLTENRYGKTTTTVYNRVTGQNIVGTLSFDRNLDGVFDENDDRYDPIEGKNVAVLMSQNGFSCGGIAPICLHDRGIFTIGDDSGGGCCSVVAQHTGVGLPTTRSASDASTDIHDVIVDQAREGSCDVKLPILEREDGSLDFSAFFDVANLQTILEEHFAPSK